MKFVSNKMMRARPLLGTFVEIMASGLSSDKLEQAIEAAFDAVGRVHALMSFHDCDSDITRLNRATTGEPIVVDRWTHELLAASADLERRSNGLFNVAVAPALQLRGLLPHVDQGAPFTTAMVRGNAFELLPGYCVRMRAGSRIDVGGIAKGFAVDRAIDVLKRCGVPNAVVNAGGDLAALGPDDHVVAIRDPRNPTQSICRVSIRTTALASSGMLFDPLTSEVNWQTAIIDPKSGGKPMTPICGATVQAPSCMIADALTKVVMIAGAGSSRNLDHYSACALFVTNNGDVQVTDHWQDVFPIAA
jgi:thiamine biosynthesis lipoprotein